MQKPLFDTQQFNGIELFCLTAECGSFTQAALKAGLTPAAVSRSVARQEQRLGVRLFSRTTRQLSLTGPGQRYYQQCRDALARLQQAELEITGSQKVPAGVIRLSAPTPYAHFRLLPLLPLFRQRYPQISFELQLSNRNVDFSTDPVDLAIRMRDPKDSTLIARKLEDVALTLVGAPAYLQQAGTPQNLTDLAQHECLQFELPSTGRPIRWRFQTQGEPLELDTHGSYRCSDDLMGLVALAKSGAGLVQTYRFMFEQELQHGELIELLPEYGGTSRPVYLLYPQARHLPHRLRLLIDFLLAQRQPAR